MNNNRNDNSISNPSKLRVPQSSGGTISMGAVSDIMKAYDSQSKIQLYDDDSAMSNNEITGVKGRDIPLSALRPKAPSGYDEDGKPIYSKSRLAEDIESRKDIAKAYNIMNGMAYDEMSELSEYEETDDYRPSRIDYSTLPMREAEYIEDVPESDEGLLMYLETIINNTRANLEMLESLYMALSGPKID